MLKKSARRKREILEAYMESGAYDEEFLQKDPYTACRVEAVVAIRGHEPYIIVGLGFSKRQEPDEWDPALGASLARRRAIADAATKFQEQFPGQAKRLIG
jgi:hypothetical protein